MCGRFTLKATPEALNKLFPSLFDGMELQPQYNVAPTQRVLAVRMRPGTTELETIRLRWGLIPSWAEDPKIRYRLINARLDTVREKPSFRAAYKNRHCLILADGFYEWQNPGTAKKKPYYIHLKNGHPFGFAGLWEVWPDDDQSVESCTIITTDANEVAKEVHDRMPVIVSPEHYRDWLDAKVSGANCAAAYLGPYPAAEMEATPVSTFVNNVRNQGPECVAPIDL
jgi:putative SOS response-associated peptidase YedK